MQSDEELVSAAIAGDRASFGTLVSRYERSVRSVAIAILREGHFADDVSQDAFLTAYERLDALRNRAAFGPWVLKIAQRCAYRAIRGARRHCSLSASGDPIMISRDDKLDDELEALLDAVVRLPPHERSVVMLKYFDELPIESIARITGRPVGTVTKQLTRARDRLGKRLGATL